MDHRIDVSSGDHTGLPTARFGPQKGSPASA